MSLERPWEKLGLIKAPSPEHWWSQSHCILPTPVLTSSGDVRVFYATCDESKKGRLAFTDFASSQPTREIRTATEPLLGPGEAGRFDDCGVNPSCFLPTRPNEGPRLLYVGYQRTEGLPYLLFPGLARAPSYDGPFTRISEVPVLERIHNEATIRTAPFVLRVPSGFRMWYVSAKSWITTPVGTSVPVYSIRTIFSESGDDWSAPSVEAIALDNEAGEVGLGRPWVVQQDGRLIMFYSVRYLRDDSTLVYLRIGCAVSLDGLTWERRDETLDFTCSSTGWDSEMVCYPAVLPVGNDWYMFYNGNRNGEGGLGCAKIFLDAL